MALADMALICFEVRTATSCVSNAAIWAEVSALIWLVPSAATSSVLREAIVAVGRDRIRLTGREEMIEVIDERSTNVSVISPCLRCRIRQPQWLSESRPAMVTEVQE
jgi:hypothetical protein